MINKKTIFFQIVLLIKIIFTTTLLYAEYSPFLTVEERYTDTALQPFSVFGENFARKEIALHQAVYTSRNAEVRSLLEEGVDPDCIIPLFGIAPLFYAIENQSCDLIILLRTYGADPDLPSQSLDHKTPLQFAREILHKFRYVCDDAFYYRWLNVIIALTQPIELEHPNFQ